MSKTAFITLIVVMAFFVSKPALGDAWDKNYTGSDGAYTNGRYRSKPDQYRWDNYGTSEFQSEYSNPYSRDYDKDGIPDVFDFDDDNDGYPDDHNRGTQYLFLE